jgi:hypothetical protein
MTTAGPGRVICGRLVVLVSDDGLVLSHRGRCIPGRSTLKRAVLSFPPTDGGANGSDHRLGHGCAAGALGGKSAPIGHDVLAPFALPE